MVLIPVCCPHCGSDPIVKRGKTKHAKPRYRGQQQDCPGKTVILEYEYKGRLPEVKQQIIEMALKGNGIRDSARVLESSPTTVINELKKSSLARWNRSIEPG